VSGLLASAVKRNDRAVAIRSLGEDLAADLSGAASVGLHVEVVGILRNLHPIVRGEV
jgi:hypothetical protein